MSTVITIEEVRFRARVIPRTQLVSVWKVLTNEPLPRVKAFQLEDDDFDYVMRLRQNREDEMRERKEWGRVLSIEETDGVYSTPTSLLMQITSYWSEKPHTTLLKKF